jgi:sigma-B regulation protein RsbU (phosphoserine phosphatase)
MNPYEKASQDQALRGLLQEALHEVHAAEGSVLLLGMGGSTLRFVVSISPVADRLLSLEQPLEKGVTGLSVCLQQPMVVNELHEHASFDPSVDRETGVTTKSLMVVPLSTPAQEFGALTAINSDKPGGFSADDLENYTAHAETIAQRLMELDLGMDDVGAFE